LLDGKTATTHWGYVEQFKQRYPKVNLKPERLITDEGDLYCSGASNACLDLSMYLIERYCGHEVAVQCAKGFLLDLGRFSQAPYSSILNFQKKHNDEVIFDEFVKSRIHRFYVLGVRKHKTPSKQILKT
jgi:transcriptional regulator GlxA family with amidase domain